MNLLLLITFAWELLTPALIFWKVLPAASRYVSGVVFVGLIVVDVAIMLRRSHAPKWVWVFLGICVYGVLVSCLNRQDLLLTLWGLYLWIKYPMVGLYAYLQPWTDLRVSRWLRQACWWVLAVEVGVEVGQYLSGILPGDQLAGTLTMEGNGTLPLAILMLWVMAMSFGVWIVRGGFRALGVSVVLGGVSAVLAEIKFFFFAVGTYLIVAGLLRMRLARSLKPLLLMGGLGVTAGLAFVWGYNAFVPAAEDISFQTFLERRSLTDYLNVEVDMSSENEYTAADIGRGTALVLGWSRIDRNTATRLFGQGLGAQCESKTLGKAGAMVQGSRYGLWTGPSVVVFLVELGLVGVALVLAFCGWTCVVLMRASRARMDIDLAVLIYALIVFTVHLPIYLWYTCVWPAPGAMFLYFFSLGYVLQRVEQLRDVAAPLRSPAITEGAYARTHPGRPFPPMGAAASRD